jgi:hypothetical protein
MNVVLSEDLELGMNKSLALALVLSLTTSPFFLLIIFYVKKFAIVLVRFECIPQSFIEIWSPV